VQACSLDSTNPQGLLVKPDIAEKQIEAEKAPESHPSPPGGNGDTGGDDIPGPVPGDFLDDPGSASEKPKRFYGTVTLDTTRVGRDAGRIAEEVIAHLSGLMGSEVAVTLEIEAKVPDGVSDQVVRIVTENSQTLRFTSHGFEKE